MAAIFILLPGILFAQAPDTVWTRRFNGPENINDYAYGCTVDTAGNIYVVGYSSSGVTTLGDDYLIIKYNSSGDTLWTRRYNSPADNSDQALGCAVDSLGNLFVVGRSTTINNWDYLTIKYNLSGDTVWTRRYNSPYSDSSLDCANACAVDRLGNVYVTGTSMYYSKFGTTLKYKTSGDTIWTRNYNQYSYSADIYACSVDKSGNLYITGYANSGYWTIKYNAIGDTLWTRSIGSGYANACAVDGSGNLYVTGTSDNDYLTIKYNATGDTLWTRRYNGPINGEDIAYACTVDDSGCVYVTGKSMGSTVYEDYDYLTIKYNAAGDTLWTCRYFGPNNGYDVACGCAVDALGNLYVTGYSYNGTNNDYLTIKYNTATGVAGKPELPITVSKLKLEQNKPNPFSQHTTISYQLSTSGPANLNIYNAAGQLVKTFDMGQQQAGHHQVEWSDSKVPAGVYFYRLVAGNYQATKKLVVVK